MNHKIVNFGQLLYNIRKIRRTLIGGVYELIKQKIKRATLIFILVKAPFFKILKEYFIF